MLVVESKDKCWSIYYKFCYRNKVEIEQQHKVFRAQLSIARETGMPIVIHCRDAENDVFDILSEVSFKTFFFFLKLFINF